MSLKKLFCSLAIVFSSTAAAQSSGFSDSSLEKLRQICIDPQPNPAVILAPETCKKNKDLFFMIYPKAKLQDYFNMPDFNKRPPEKRKLVM